MNDFALIATSSASVGAVAALSWWPAVEMLRTSDRGIVAKLRTEMLAVGMDVTSLPAQVLAWRGAAIGTFAAVAFLLGQLPLAVILAAIVHFTCPWWFRLRMAAHQRLVNDQVAGVSRALAGRVRVGLPLHQALTEVSIDAPAPLGEYLRETARRFSQGSSTYAALGALKERVGVDAVRMMTVALQVADERGGRLATVLDRISHSAEELSRLRRKREADTAAGRLMITVMAAFPILFVVLVYTIDPEMITTAFALPAGQLILAAVAGVVYGSVRWGSRILSRVN